MSGGRRRRAKQRVFRSEVPAVGRGVVVVMGNLGSNLRQGDSPRHPIGPSPHF
jgi:hypothetical protein